MFRQSVLACFDFIWHFEFTDTKVEVKHNLTCRYASQSEFINVFFVLRLSNGVDQPLIFLYKFETARSLRAHFSRYFMT